jgi:hypothetical protein
MKRYRTSLFIREMKNKHNEILFYTEASAGADVENCKPYTLLVGVQWCSHCEKKLVVSQHVKYQSYQMTQQFYF